MALLCLGQWQYLNVLSYLTTAASEALEIHRGFACFQFMTILEEAHHSIFIVEHDPMLYEDAAEMVDYVSHALANAAKEAAVLLYSPGAIPSWKRYPGTSIGYGTSMRD